MQRELSMLGIAAGVVLGFITLIVSGLALSGLIWLLEKVPAFAGDVTARADDFAQSAFPLPDVSPREQSLNG
jgi:hypothetical protein